MTTVVLAHGPGGLFDFFPILFLAGALYVIVMALRDGQDKKPKTRTIPTNPLSRQLHAATRPRVSDRSTVPSADRSPGRRYGAPRLRVLDGEAADGNRPAVPRRFEPPPPRRKTG